MKIALKALTITTSMDDIKWLKSASIDTIREKFRYKISQVNQLKVCDAG